MDSPDGLIRGEPGGFVINKPREHFWHTHTEDAQIGFINCWCHIYFDGADDFFKKHGLIYDTIHHTVDSFGFMRDLLDIKKEIDDRENFSPDMAVLLIKKMIINLSKQNKLYNIRNMISNEKRVKDIIELRSNMLANYDREYNLSDLAKELDISEDYFCSLYKKIFDISPKKDLCLKRIEQAKILLISTDMTVNKIADACGYSDANYFSRLFKKITGIAPVQFRQ
jgi:AraC-like DNA-binding protein